jgi:hypothetical protein
MPYPHILMEILASIRVKAVELESAPRWPSGIFTANKRRLAATTVGSISSASAVIANDTSGSGSDSPRFVRRSQTLLLFLIVRHASIDDAQSLDPGSTTDQQQLVQPHTPADQVLHSAADRWGLLALVRALRSQTDDALSSGQDLGLLGMELDNPGYGLPSSSNFVTNTLGFAGAYIQNLQHHGQTMHPQHQLQSQTTIYHRVIT